MINCRVRKIVVQNLNYNEAGTASSLFSFTAIRSIVHFFSPYISAAAIFQSVETDENASD